MSGMLPKQATYILLLLSVVVLLHVVSAASNKPAPTYEQTGTVTTVATKHGHSYQIATDSRTYLMQCMRVRTFQIGSKACMTDGGKALAAGDTVHFRVDRDDVYMPLPKGKEERLEILSSDLKTVPPLPPVDANDQSSNVRHEQGIVIGTRIQADKSYSPPSSTGTTTSSVPGPVVAIPVTGGSPEVVIPTGPASGSIVTGIPAAGGPPVTAIATSPMPTTASDDFFPNMGGTPKIHALRIQSSDKIYKVACPRNSCTAEGKVIALGDTVGFYTDQHWMYIGSNAKSSSKERYKILKVIARAAAAPAAKSN